MTIFAKLGTPYDVTSYGNPSTLILDNTRDGGLDVKFFVLERIIKDPNYLI